MPIKDGSDIEITALRWVPDGARGLVKDLRVRWALEEAGLDYQVRLVGAPRPAGYSAEQPFNQVPCFRAGDIRIFETGAIVQYIAEKSGTLLPPDPQGRFRAIQWSYAALSSVEPFIQQRALLDSVFAGEHWARLSKPTMDQFATTRLHQLSERFGDSPWLDGEQFTIGDLMMVTVLRIADRARLLAPFPRLTAYVKRGEARPAFGQALSDQLAAFTADPPQAQGAAA